MARKLTKEIQYVRLSEKRIREIEDLVASWPYETRAFMRAGSTSTNRPLISSMRCWTESCPSLWQRPPKNSKF